MEEKPIIIMIAMEDAEGNFLLEKLENIQVNQVGKYKFYEGTIKSNPVVICICHVMSINAAIATFIAIEKYQPRAIITQGTAGAHSQEIHTGDIILGQKCMNIVSARTPLKRKGEGSNSLTWELVNFICGEEDRLEYQFGDAHLLELAKQIPYEKGKVYTGTLGSGDVWNRETDKILTLNQTYGTLCEDMESIAVYLMANQFNIPVLGIRVISNNEILEEPYIRQIGKNSQEFTYELILKMIQER